MIAEAIAAVTGPLHLPTPLAAALAAAAEAAYPEEFCALLLGHATPAGPTVTRIVPAANTHPEPRRAFELDPATLIATLRRLRDHPTGERLLGHAHSHPDGPACPSETDRGMAYEPGQIWLLYGVANGRAGTPTAWCATEDEQGEPALVAHGIRIDGEIP